MIEKLVADYLNSELLVPCVLEVPEDPKPEQYVVVEKTGSSVYNHLHSDSIAVQSCAGSLYAAALLNESVKATMSDLIADHRISRCKLDTDYNFTDPQSKQYRYQAIFRITYLEV